MDSAPKKSTDGLVNQIEGYKDLRERNLDGNTFFYSLDGNTIDIYQLLTNLMLLTKLTKFFNSIKCLKGLCMQKHVSVVYLIKLRYIMKISLHCGVVSNVKSIFVRKHISKKWGVLIAIWSVNINAIFTAQILHLAQNVKLGRKGIARCTQKYCWCTQQLG